MQVHHEHWLEEIDTAGVSAVEPRHLDPNEHGTRGRLDLLNTPRPARVDD